MCKVDLQGWAVVLIEPGNGIQVQLHCAVKVPKAQVEVGEVNTHMRDLYETGLRCCCFLDLHKPHDCPQNTMRMEWLWVSSFMVLLIAVSFSL